MLYLENTISVDLHKSRKLTSNFDIEIKSLKAKYNKAGYPRRFFESFIRDFIANLNKNQSFAIPPNMFEGKKPFLVLAIPYCSRTKLLLNDL